MAPEHAPGEDGALSETAAPHEPDVPGPSGALSRDRTRPRPGRTTIAVAVVLVGAAAVYAVARGLPGGTGGSAPPPELDRSDRAVAADDEISDDGVSVVRLVEGAGDEDARSTTGEGDVSAARAVSDPAPGLATLLGARPVLVSFGEPRSIVTEAGRRFEAGARASNGVAVITIGDDAIVLERNGRRVEAALPDALARYRTTER